MPGQTVPRHYGAFIQDGSAIGPGGTVPDSMGLKVWNATGSGLTVGQLLYVSGWNAANGLPQVSLADNHVGGAHAQYVVTATIPNGAAGMVSKHWLSAASLNTNAGNVGDPVYLDSTLGGGAGTWTLTANSGPTNRLEIIGRITVKDAAVGQIDFDLQSNKWHVGGTNELQPLAVGGAAIALGAVTPDKQGITVWNATGLTITVGQLCYVSGWNVANNMPQVSLAANNVANAAATLVCAIQCATGASTLMRKHFLSPATLNVGGSVGDPVYLDSVAGGWTQTTPSAPTSRQQIIGRVVAVSASVGQIDFDVVSSGGTVISRADIQPGDVSPDDSGITVWNASGGGLTAGQLVYVSGWNAANSLPQISQAINNAANSNATYILPATINNGASGQARRHWLSAANLNTNAASGVGAAVYLDSTLGGWTLTAPTAPTSNQQIVGRVVVKDPAVGQIDFDVESNPGNPGVEGTTSLQSGSVTPDLQGLPVWNASGGTLTANTLVYVSGWNAANAMPQISAANPGNQGQLAAWVVPADILNGASGQVRKHLTTAANLNTNAGNVGDPVYMTTAGAWTLTALTAATQHNQIVGRIRVKDAAVGVVEFDLTSGFVSVWGNSDLQNLCITAAQIAAATITQAKMATASVYPDQQAITVWNATGSGLTAGQLVYLSGWNAANAMPQVSLSSSNTASTTLGDAIAEYVVPAAISNGASGVVQKHWLSAANLNTGGSVIGNPVWLDSVAGGWTLTTPAASNKRGQIVGRVLVVDGAVGQIDFDCASHPPIQWVGSNEMAQQGEVLTASLAANAVTSAKVATNVLQTLTLTLTNAQVKALRATPITVIAAPGTNNWIEYVSGALLLKAGANVFTVGGNLALRMQNSSGAKISEDVNMTGFLDQATDQITSMRAKQDAIVATAVFLNQPVVIHNIGAAEETGNAAADATLIVKVSYRIWINT